MPWQARRVSQPLPLVKSATRLPTGSIPCAGSGGSGGPRVHQRIRRPVHHCGARHHWVRGRCRWRVGCRRWRALLGQVENRCRPCCRSASVPHPTSRSSASDFFCSSQKGAVTAECGPPRRLEILRQVDMDDVDFIFVPIGKRSRLCVVAAQLLGLTGHMLSHGWPRRYTARAQPVALGPQPSITKHAPAAALAQQAAAA